MQVGVSLRRAALVGVAVAVAAAGTAGSTAVAAAEPGTGVVTEWVPVADTFVRSSAPSSSYGSRAYLQADGDPEVRSYLRFAVSGAPAGPQPTVLRLRHSTANPSPPFCDEAWECWHVTRIEVRAVSGGGWTETTTYATAPPVGEVLGLSSDVAGRQFFVAEIDLGNLVNGDGVYELVITGNSSTNQTFASRESASPPRLVIAPAT
jgi:hypothetical protein